MREEIHIAPVNESFESGDECPFCYLERRTEQRCIRYVIGPGNSFMEPEVRDMTNREGFCAAHLKKLFDYGNPLGTGLIVRSYMARLQRELQQELDKGSLPPKRKLLKAETTQDSTAKWIRGKLASCYICRSMEENMDRYYNTFFVLTKDKEFRQKVESCKGFCMRHYAELLERAPQKLPLSQREWFYGLLPRLMTENLQRVQKDLNWFTEKFDYKNAKADWGNSRDALQRAMEKYQGLHPADPPYKKD